MAVSGDPLLILPLDCTLGEDCHIQQYVDQDPSPEAQDFTCGKLSYDGHDGTDFALPTLRDQARGVNVLAAADGVVTGVRDEMADVLQTGPDAPDVTGRECGNGLVLRHADGWETQYCHMALGSLTVTEGQEVSAGDVLGRVGLSGQTQFPHLHLSVRRDGEAVDPFAPAARDTCDDPGPGLWASPLPYEAGGFLTSGFAADVPDFEALKAGDDVPAPTATTPLVAWGLLFGGQAGDLLTIRIDGPGGRVIDEAAPLDRDQAQLFRAAGLRAPDGGWPAGNYTFALRLLRDGDEVDTATGTITLAP